MWVNEHGQTYVMSDHTMLVMTCECGREKTRTEIRSTCTHWKVRGVDWNDYKIKKKIERTVEYDGWSR